MIGVDVYSYPRFSSSSVVNFSISLFIAVPFGVRSGSPGPTISFTIYRSNSRPSSTLLFRSLFPLGACIFTLLIFFSIRVLSCSDNSASCVSSDLNSLESSESGWPLTFSSNCL